MRRTAALAVIALLLALVVAGSRVAKHMLADGTPDAQPVVAEAAP